MTRLASFIALTLILCLCPTTTRAATFNDIGIAPAATLADRDPSGFHYVGRGGQSIPDSIKLINIGDTPKVIGINIIDATITEANGISCPATSISTTRWVSLSTMTVTVAGGSSTYIPFTLTVPSDFNHGEYNGCVVAQAINGAGATSGVPLTTRVAMRLSVTSPSSTRPNVSLHDPELKLIGNQLVAAVTVENNNSFSLINTIAVDRPAAKHRTSVLLPHASKRASLQLMRRPFWGGYYDVTMKSVTKQATSSWTKQSPATTTVTHARLFVPPRSVALFVITGAIFILAIAGVIFVKLRKKLRT